MTLDPTTKEPGHVKSMLRTPIDDHPSLVYTRTTRLNISQKNPRSSGAGTEVEKQTTKGGLPSVRESEATSIPSRNPDAQCGAVSFHAGGIDQVN